MEIVLGEKLCGLLEIKAQLYQIARDVERFNDDLNPPQRNFADWICSCDETVDEVGALLLRLAAICENVGEEKHYATHKHIPLIGNWRFGNVRRFPRKSRDYVTA